MTEIVYKYDEKKNVHNGRFPGVPQADLTEDLVKSLRPAIVKGIEKCGFYIKVVKPPKSGAALSKTPSLAKMAGDK